MVFSKTITHTTLWQTEILHYGSDTYSYTTLRQTEILHWIWYLQLYDTLTDRNPSLNMILTVIRHFDRQKSFTGSDTTVIRRFDRQNLALNSYTTMWTCSFCRNGWEFKLDMSKFRNFTKFWSRWCKNLKIEILVIRRFDRQQAKYGIQTW